MGNIANEASTDLDPTLLEYGSTSRTSLSGEQYTNLVDAGIISRDEVIRSARFGLYSGGRYGYGLCGFTDPTIKEYLCRYTIDLGKSLGSLSGQLDSLLAYLNDYNPNLLDRLKNAEDVDTAATSFMLRIRKMRKSGYAAETPHNSSRADLQCDGIVRFTGGCGIKEQKIYQ